MSVSLSPSSSLGFPRPLTRVVNRDLAISNHNAQPVAFKVKTTAPKLYCVRPNSGRVEPGETVVVNVMLQSLKEEPPLGAKCKDKFLIQSTIISPDKDTLSLTELWASPDNEGKIQQQKLRVIYQAAEGQTLEEEDESQVNMSSIIGNDSRYDTVRQAPVNGHESTIPEFNDTTEFSHAPEEAAPHRAVDSGAPAVTVDPPTSPEEVHVAEPIPVPPPVKAVPVFTPPAPAPVPAPVAAPVVTPAPAPVPAAPAQPSPEFQKQLSEANAEIERLRTLLATAPAAAPLVPALRKRTKALSDDGSVADSDTGTYIEEFVQPEGVPLQVVVIIALGVFITTYVFF